MDEHRLEKRRCADGSYTFLRTDLQESYHAPVGAALEAREKYVAPCELQQRAKKGSVRILDVCFGFGYNTAAALEVLLSLEQRPVITVTALEIDKDILGQSLSLPFPFEHKEIFEKLAEAYDEEERAFRYEQDELRITLFIGDALERVGGVAAGVDVVLFDPFSPRKAPELWTAGFFKDIFGKCVDGAVLVTYSCARKVREALQEAGFAVEDGPVIGRRGPATVARAAKDS